MKTKRTPEIELQLASMASSADRANRPAWMLVLPVIMLVLAAAYLFFAWSNRSEAQTQLMNAWSTQNQITHWMQKIEIEKQKQQPLKTRYLPKPNAGSDIERQAASIDGFTEPPVVGARVERQVAFNADITSWYVECRVSRQPLEPTMEWIDKVLSSSLLDGVFISKLQLVPDPSIGWNAQIDFKWYERK